MVAFRTYFIAVGLFENALYPGVDAVLQELTASALASRWQP